MIKEGIVFFALVTPVFFVSNAAAVPSGQVVRWEGGGQGQVKFEGEEHAEKGYKCEACHPSLFQMKKGSAKMTMALMAKGQFCGACHNGKTAFSTGNPQKCHECHKNREKHPGDKEEHHNGKDRYHE